MRARARGRKWRQGGVPCERSDLLFARRNQRRHLPLQFVLVQARQLYLAHCHEGKRRGSQEPKEPACLPAVLARMAAYFSQAKRNPRLS